MGFKVQTIVFFFYDRTNNCLYIYIYKIIIIVNDTSFKVQKIIFIYKKIKNNNSNKKSTWLDCVIT